jgi:hypothetical protein
MAIEGFGESLLGEKRARDNKRKKKQQTYDTLGAAASIGIGMYRNSLAEKQKDFLKSEEVNKLKITYGAAKADSDEAFAVQSDINSSQYAEADYFQRKAYEQQKNIFYSERPDIKHQLDIGAHEPTLRKAAREIGARQLKAHKDRYGRAVTFRNSGSFADSLELVNNRPQSVFEAFRNRKSDQELSDEAAAAWKEGSVATNAMDVSVFSDAYDKSKNLSSSFEYAKAVKELTPVEQLPFISEQQEPSRVTTRPSTDADGQIIPGSEGVKGVLRVTTVTNNYLQIEHKKEIFIPLMSAEDSEKDVARKAARARSSAYNIYAKAPQLISREGMVKFQKALDDNGIGEADRLDPPSTAVYDKMARIFADIAGNPADRNQKISEAMFNKVMGEISNSPVTSAAINAHLSKRNRVSINAQEAGITFEEQAIKVGFDYAKWHLELADITTESNSSIAGGLGGYSAASLNSPYFKD